MKENWMLQIFADEAEADPELPVETVTEPEADPRQQREKEMLDYVEGLHRQGEALRKRIPGFSLKRELKDEKFAKLVSPQVGLSVEEAYFMVHHRQIRERAQRESAKQTARQMADAIRAGSQRPRENGISPQAPSAAVFDYRKATVEQRNALKKAIREASARGEKLYPGGKY